MNGLPSSKEVLTAEEYEQYMQALMTYETTMVKIGLPYVRENDAIPLELQQEFTEAQDMMNYVNDKQVEVKNELGSKH